MKLADRSEAPNVLVVVLDTLRADAVEPYGGPAGSSPTLAQLARRGAAIADVRATASWTLPSHVSMFTGELARGVGLGQAPEAGLQAVAPVIHRHADRMLPEVMRRAGYATGGVSANMWVSRHSGFDTGFNDFTALDTSRHGELGGTLTQRFKWDAEAVRAHADDGAAAAEAVIERWVREIDSRPFFWFANVVECHSPYLPPKPFDRSNVLTRLRAADEAHRYLTFEAIVRACVGALHVPGDAIERMRRLYAASLLYVDRWLERVLERLSSAGVLEDTLVIACSDHGENFGEGGLMAHAMSVDDRLLRVPFIAAGPGAGEFDGMRSLAELPARVAAAAGLEDHPWRRGLDAGLAVAQWDPLAPADHPRVQQIVSEWAIDDAGVRRLTSPLTCAVTGRLKLVVDGGDGREELYDLERDPLEIAPLREEPEMAALAGDVLHDLRAAARHCSVQATATADAVAEPASTEEVADLERRMRMMGYM